MFILDEIKLMLENNTFCFDNNFHTHNKGTAMGTKFATVYAALTIGYLEETLYEEARTLHCKNFGDYIVQN